MKAVILAGGYGTRISEETDIRPKPMVEIGGWPILWHVMKIYSRYGINEFVICCGYKSHVIKDFFANYIRNHSDVSFDLETGSMEIKKKRGENWKVTLVETGDKTMTGGRLKRAQEYIGSETFCMTYGDGVSDVNIEDLIKFHKEQKALATVTAVASPGRFGAFNLKADQALVDNFQEKPHGEGVRINGGFFVLEPEVFDYIKDDATTWEREPMEKLVEDRRLAAFAHEGFWQCMDTLRDKNVLEDLWKSGQAPWKVW